MVDEQNKSTFSIAGRNFVARQNISRFELVQDLFLAPIVPLVFTSTDDLTAHGRNQKAQLKDIIFRLYMPTCSPDGIALPNQDVTPIEGVYSTYTFLVSINSMITEYAVTFNKNADEWRDQLWMVSFPTVINEISVRVRRDSIALNWVGAPVTLSATLEFYVFNE